MGEAVVHIGESIQLSLDVDLIFGVQVHFKSLGTIHLMTNSLAHNLGGVNNVLKDLLVDGGESSGARARALLKSRAVESLGEDSSLCNNNNMAAAGKYNIRNISKKSGLRLT